MGFIAKILTAVLEYIIAQAFALGAKQYQEIENDEAIKKKSEQDSQALASAKDTAGRVATLEKIANDTFNPTIKPK